LSRLLPHVLSSPNYNNYQSAYRLNHSTETAMIKILDDVYCDIGKHQQTILVGLDLSAAFDTIDQSTLIQRLDMSFGIRGTALNWIRSYLTDMSVSDEPAHTRSSANTAYPKTPYLVRYSSPCMFHPSPK